MMFAPRGIFGTSTFRLALLSLFLSLFWMSAIGSKSKRNPHDGEMPTATLYNEISISLIGLGCASGVRRQHVKAALESGYKFLDTAQAYQWGYQEHEVADAVIQYLQANENAEVFVQTKVHPENLGYDTTTKMVHQSIDKFKGHLDSVLIHKPRCWAGACSREPEGTWQDSWRALEDLYDQGLIRAIGICDVDKWLLKELLRQRIKPHIIQSM